MTWKEREIDRLLRQEFAERGFFLLGSCPESMAPMPMGFASSENATKFLRLERMAYRYVAYRNMSASAGFFADEERTVTANLFIKVGSASREPFPICDLTSFYDGKMYKYSTLCRDFTRRLDFARNEDDVAGAVKSLMAQAADTVETWQRSVRTLIMENRWPEEAFVSDLDLMDMRQETEYWQTHE